MSPERRKQMDVESKRSRQSFNAERAKMNYQISVERQLRYRKAREREEQLKKEEEEIEQQGKEEKRRSELEMMSSGGQRRRSIKPSSTLTQLTTATIDHQEKLNNSNTATNTYNTSCSPTISSTSSISTYSESLATDSGTTSSTITSYVDEYLAAQINNLKKKKREIIAENALKMIAEKYGVTAEKELILYCRTSVRATPAFIAFNNILGYKNVKVYDGAYLEWVASHPVIQ